MSISIDQAISLLKQGECLAVPTETVYGLAASIHSPKIQEVFLLKNRSLSKPLTILIPTFSMIESIASSLPPLTETLAKTFWPGPLTLVLPSKESVPKIIRSNLPTIGIRIPNHPITLKLLHEVGPLVAPSANLSNTPSATKIKHVIEDFGDTLPFIDGGDTPLGLESTLLSYDKGWHLLREGAITKEKLEPVIGSLQRLPLPKAPLSPRITWSTHHPLPKDNSSIVIGFNGRSYGGSSKVVSIGDLNNPQVIGRSLYSHLRALQKEKGDLWIDLDFGDEGLLRPIKQTLMRFLITTEFTSSS